MVRALLGPVLSFQEVSMRVIVAGSRSIGDRSVVEQAIKESGFEISELVSGGAKGVDRLAAEWQKANSVPVRLFRPDWKRFKRGAGLAGNHDMAAYADALVAVWDGESRGTADMIQAMRALGKPVHVFRLGGSVPS